MIAQLNESVAAQQREIETLRSQLGTANKTAEGLRHENEQARSETQRASSQVVPFPAELQNRDKQLEDARNEIQRINQLRSGDAASLAAQQVRIAELSDQLRIASATLDLERQLTAAGKDIRELLTARELHVIDVRDTDANGKPTKAFGRIFVTEGGSCMLTTPQFASRVGSPLDFKFGFSHLICPIGPAPIRIFNMDMYWLYVLFGETNHTFARPRCMRSSRHVLFAGLPCAAGAERCRNRLGENRR